jgi:glycolate oxidase iron-sulfur subunit
MDSPRGRIYLMRGATEGRLELTPSLVQHFDACLGCVACMTACPSGVQYGPLIEGARAQIEQRYTRPAGERAFRAALFAALPYPSVMRALLAPLALAGGLVDRLKRSPWLSRMSRRIVAPILLAPRVSWTSLTTSVAERTPAAAPARMKVGLLTGCVQRLVFPQVHKATINVLSAEGCEVLAPAGQGCCGALSRHAGRLDESRAFARGLIEIFERTGVDRVVVNAAGCGSSMKEYGELLADDPAWKARAHAFAGKVRDVSELVVELGAPRVTRHPIQAKVAYHDACHLAHAQSIRTQPRDLLRAIPGIEIVELAESDICCGSAGIYNLVQPEPAAALGDRKAAHVVRANPDVVATANPGCTLQIGAACERRGFGAPIMHPIEILDASLRGVGLPARAEH